MAQALAIAAEQQLERGSVRFLYRPRVEEQHPDELGDVQRILVQLAPDDSPYERLLAIGRKRMPRRHDRFWGFVDLVLTPNDMQAALGAHVYGTKTRGLRHLPAAQPFASGTYTIDWHASHAHLRWQLDEVAGDDPIAAELRVEHHGDLIVTVANPDPTAWGLIEVPDLQRDLFDDLELHVTIPTPFPPSLQDRFRNRRFTQLDTTEWLDHPGAELVFVGEGAGAGASRLVVELSSRRGVLES